MKIGISGASGFVGSHLLRRLSADHDVRALSRNPAVEGSLDLLVHAGGLVGGAHPAAAYFEANVDNAVAVARAAAAMGAKRAILLSTGAANDPSGPYAESKKAGEDAVRDILPAQVLRLYFPYGPGQSEERLIPRLIRRIHNGEPVTEGPRITPIFIGDLVAIIAALTAIDQPFVADAGGPEIVSIHELAEEIGRLLSITPVIQPAEASSRDWIADNAKIVAMTKTAPRVGISEGLRSML